MNMKKIFAVPEQRPFANMALLLIRVVAGLAFTIHGWSKIQNPFGWMGPEGFAPGYLQLFAAIAEFGGGLGWILGLMTPLASLGIACTMAVAFSMLTFMQGAPFVSNTGGTGSELPAVYFCVSVLLIVIGPGRFSVDRRIFGKIVREE